MVRLVSELDSTEDVSEPALVARDHLEALRRLYFTIIEHLRDLQDETAGFLTYIPLAYHPDNNELGEQLGAN